MTALLLPILFGAPNCLGKGTAEGASKGLAKGHGVHIPENVTETLGPLDGVVAAVSRRTGVPKDKVRSATRNAACAGYKFVRDNGFPTEEEELTSYVFNQFASKVRAQVQPEREAVQGFLDKVTDEIRQAEDGDYIELEITLICN